MEVCGLEWSDIDFEENTIYINRSRQSIPGLAAFDKTPKTERSKRTIKMPEVAMTMLRLHKIDQVKTRLKIGIQWKDSAKVVTQWNGVAMNPQTPSHWLSKWLKLTDFRI